MNLDFWRFYRIIRKRRWLIICLVLGTTAIVTIGVMLRPRLTYFQAATTVLPSQQALERPIAAGASIEPGAMRGGDPEYKATLMELIFSQALATKAIEEAGLHTSPDSLRNRITVETVQSRERTPTKMLRISARADSASEAVETVNAVTRAFVDFYSELSRREATANRQLLEAQLEIARENLQKTGKALQNFKMTKGLTALPEEATASLGLLTPLQSQNDSTEASLRETEAQLAVAKAQLGSQPETKITEVGASSNPLVQQLQGQLAQLENDLITEKSKHTPKHPNVIALENKIANIQQRLQQEISKAYKTVQVNPIYQGLLQQMINLETQKAGLAAKLGAIRSALTREQARLNRLSGAEAQLAALTRDYRGAEETYNALINNLNRVRMEEQITNTAGALRIIDLASQAQGPIREGRNPLKLVLAGAFLSLALGIGLSLGLDFIDNTIKSSQDVQSVLELPVTGVIPHVRGALDSKVPQITHLEPLSPYAEAYRFLRTDIFFSVDNKPVKTIMVATAKPFQGATCAIANLAISMANAGKRVILVDADLRRPSLHKIFNVSNEVGLTSVVYDDDNLEQALKATDIDNLLLLPGGPPTRHPSELLGSQEMKDLIEILKERSDFVLFDTSSAIAFTDAAILSSVVDGVLLVVRAHQVPRGTELQVKNLLNKAKANVIGVVLNDVIPESVDSYYYYSHYYHDIEQRRHEIATIEEPQPEALATKEQETAVPEEPLELVTPLESEGPSEETPKPESQSFLQATLNEEAFSLDAPTEQITEVKEEKVKRPETIKKRIPFFTITIGIIVLLGIGALLVYFYLGRAKLMKPNNPSKAPTNITLSTKKYPPQQPAVVIEPIVEKNQKPPIPANNGVELTARVNQETWLRVVADDKKVFEGTLTPEKRQWTAKEKITIRSGNAGSTEITKNGQYLGKLGQPGQIVEKTFSR